MENTMSYDQWKTASPFDNDLPDLTATKNALKCYDTGHWDYDKIDVCLTGKYADLDPSGYQGFAITGLTDETITLTARIGKTFCADPPDFNDMSESDDEILREYYLEQSQEIVCGCNVPGDWSGDDWFLYDSIDATIPIIYDDDEIDAPAMAAALVSAAEKALNPIADEFILADEIQTNVYRDLQENYLKILKQIKEYRQ
jgi:hypothetical protein